jgi:hypothetical protein
MDLTFLSCSANVTTDVCTYSATYQIADWQNPPSYVCTTGVTDLNGNPISNNAQGAPTVQGLQKKTHNWLFSQKTKILITQEILSARVRAMRTLLTVRIFATRLSGKLAHCFGRTRRIVAIPTFLPASLPLHWMLTWVSLALCDCGKRRIIKVLLFNFSKQQALFLLFCFLRFETLQRDLPAATSPKFQWTNSTQLSP